MIELAVFVVSAVIILGGAVGVVVNRNAVHAALSLVATLFGIAVLFIAQEAHFLAAVQVIVYAGAIVVLFLFVIMLLGVDRAEDLTTDPIPGQRPAAGVVAVVLGVGLSALLIAATVTGARSVTGIIAEPGDSALVDPTTGTEVRRIDGTFVGTDGELLQPVPPQLQQPDTGFVYDTEAGTLTDATGAVVGRDDDANIDRLAETLFTDHVFAFEVTSVLLVIAVVGAVMLARRPPTGGALDAEEPAEPLHPDDGTDADADPESDTEEAGT